MDSLQYAVDVMGFAIQKFLSDTIVIEGIIVIISLLWLWILLGWIKLPGDDNG